MELVFLAVERGEEAADAGVRAGPSQMKSCWEVSRSYQGTSVGMTADLAKRIISLWWGRYLAWSRGRLRLREGSARSGMMRSGSKSMVLPKPWQRGHAP